MNVVGDPASHKADVRFQIQPADPPNSKPQFLAHDIWKKQTNEQKTTELKHHK